MSKSKPKAPAAPDYVGAANATAAGNLEAVKYQTEANRINQTNPWGSLTYSTDANGKVTQNETLDPGLQAALNSQIALQKGRSDVANGLMGQVADSFNTPYVTPDRASYTDAAGAVSNKDFGTAGQFTSNAAVNTSFNPSAPALNTDLTSFNAGVPAQNAANLASGQYTQNALAVNQNAPQFDATTAGAELYAKKALEAQTALLAPQWEKQQEALQNNLRLQGLSVTSEANQNAQLAQSLALAAQQNSLAAGSYASGAEQARANYGANLAGFNASNAARGQAFSQGLASQGADLNAQQVSNAANNTQFNQNLAGFGANQGAVSNANAARNQVYQNELSQFNAQNQAQLAQLGIDQTKYATNLQGMQSNAQLQGAQNAAQSQAYAQALQNYGIDQGNSLADRQRALNEMNALLNGQQVQDPSFQGFAQQGYAPGADLLGAVSAKGQYDQNAYNAALAKSSGGLGGLLGLAGTIGGAFAGSANGSSLISGLFK